MAAQLDFALADAARVFQRQRQRESFFELSLDLACVADFSGTLVQVNPAFQSALGLPATEENNLLDLVHPDDRAALASELGWLTEGGMMFDFPCRVKRCDGTFRDFEWRATSDPDGLIYCVARDVTEAKRLQRELSDSLSEKLVLLQEVHHRVKNNLQVMLSLIGMQIRQISSTAGKEALRQTQARFQAISLIHDNAYRTKDYARVPFAEYVTSLVDRIKHDYGVTALRVRVQIEVEELELPVDTAIPCGLILNELVRNAVQHAFPAGRSGTIRIALRNTPEGRLRLEVSDDGIGLPREISIEEVRSIGLQLVVTLTEQLDGELEATTENGVSFRITFGAIPEQ